MRLVADRQPREATAALAGTWAAFAVALVLAVRQPPEPLVLAGVLGGAFVVVAGFAATSRCRPLGARPVAERARRGAISLASGAALGAALLAVLAALARVEPALRARFAGRLGEPTWRPWALAFESSILEEVVFRLFVMGAVGWAVARVIGRSRAALPAALAASVVLFGAAHLPAWHAAGAGGVALVTVVLLLNGIGGALFGWVFWRWGLPYAVLCHFAGDAVIQTLAPRLLG